MNYQAPLWDDEYTGPRWRYGLQYRPARYASVPDGWLLGSVRPSAEFAHGTIDYPRELTKYEAAAFELTPLGEVPGKETTP